MASDRHGKHNKPTIAFRVTPYEQQVINERVEELVELMLDAICTTKKYLQINGEAMPSQVVKNRLLKVGYEHIQYVFFSLSKNTTKVKNIRQYMLTVLYNAPVTINQFYDAEVRHDMYGG